jgi:hypothetical protein
MVARLKRQQRDQEKKFALLAAAPASLPLPTPNLSALNAAPTGFGSGLALTCSTIRLLFRR